jgi:hypothetical protein
VPDVTGARRLPFELRRSLPRSASIALAAVTAVLATSVAAADAHYGRPTPPLDQVVASAGSAVRLIAVVVGVLLHGNDVRHRTLGRWLPLAGSRRRFVGSKLGAAALVTGVIGAVGAAIGAVAGTAAGAADGASLADVLGAATDATVAATAAGTLGCALAVLVNGMALPLVLLLVGLPQLEVIIRAGQPSLGRWLPTTLANELVSPTPNAPSASAQVAGLVVWVVVAAVAAVLTFERRDITAKG